MGKIVIQKPNFHPNFIAFVFSFNQRSLLGFTGISRKTRALLIYFIQVLKNFI